MNKVKLAICMQDLEYQARFVNCLMNHYKHQYEVHVFTDVEELKATNPQTYSCVIMDEYTIEDMANFVEEGVKLLCLAEAESGDEKSVSERIVCTGKYQEVYKITEVIEQMTDRDFKTRCGNTVSKRTAVYSFSKEQLQTPLIALLAELYGEKERVLVLDLQPFSGFDEREDEEIHMGLEDILTIAMTGNYSRARLLESIGHMTNWDYIYPVRNTECLVEGNAKLYEVVLEMLEKELGYERILINFGAIFPGWLDILVQCEEIYFLVGKEKDRNWREHAFREELQRKNLDEVYRKVKYLEVSASSSVDCRWKSLVEKWRYSSLGERLRQSICREKSDGENM